MNFGQKAIMVKGTYGGYVGNIPGNSSLGIPSLNCQDGPAGIGDGLYGVTAFPAPIALAASWDVSLAQQYGITLGAEARGKGVEVLLGPMMNMARAYEDGRAFEGYGEDPYLAGAMAAAEIPGIQSQGVIATAKHFVCNDQETERRLISADVDQRTLQEIYYAPFRASVRAGVGAVMASYNRVNSRYACESEALNTTLKKSWGFNGWVMSDWGASFTTVAALDNGLDMDMYSGGFAINLLNTAFQSGNAPASELDDMVQRILTSMFQFGLFDHPPTGNLGAYVASSNHVQFARDAAAQGIVLLENRGGLLPLNPSSIHSIAVFGPGAQYGYPTGGGSANVNITYPYSSPLSGIASRAGSNVTVQFVQDPGAASNSDVAIICVGQQTSEGYDRPNLSLIPPYQDALISQVAAVNTNTIVVVFDSSAVLMPWADKVAAVLMAWYPGLQGGNALAQVLFGDVNPSGKLPITIPAATNEVPANTAAQFPGINGHAAYSEGLQIGYRWYDANNVAPLFPFGHGLSYTTFGYSNLTVEFPRPIGHSRKHHSRDSDGQDDKKDGHSRKHHPRDSDGQDNNQDSDSSDGRQDDNHDRASSGQVVIGFDLSNTGGRAGAEVAELYLGFPAAAMEPPKLLKGFQKIFLAPGQTQHVTFNLDWEDLANWDAVAHGWIVTPGTFQVMVGASSRDIRLTGAFTVGSVISSDLANAALHQPVTVSSELSTNTPGSAAVDGDVTSDWASQASSPQWISVDLGFVKDLSRVRLRWDTNYARAYAIRISADGTVWRTLFAADHGRGGTEDILVSGRGRYVRIYATEPGLPGSGYSLSELEVYSQAQAPFGGTVPSMPGVIQAENYDVGGEGVAYHNSTVGNPGGAYRGDDVGIEPTLDTGGGYDVGVLTNGEWLEYTVRLPDAEAIYRPSVRVASPSGGGLMRLRLDGTVVGVAQIPDTGGWQDWQTVTLPEVPLAGGDGSHILRLEVLNGGFNLNWIALNRVQISGTNNIALNQPAFSSSFYSSSSAAAFDGDLTTEWSSDSSYQQWIGVDLGSVQNLARVRLNWVQNFFAQNYTIQFSTDLNTWTNVYTTTNGAGSINDLATLGSGRYVRMYTQSSNGYALWEFEVYPALAPTLGIARLGTNIVLSWPAMDGWKLEETRLTGPAARWTPVTKQASSTNSQNLLSMPSGPDAHFYRLRQVP
jgi:beta-glucosidase